ncbi:TasA family protein [Arthrobacter mobilis]|uniref:Camelysin metallo-endopeptidase n=1 Tax=Arthrobacter mobilis TaxID=2724944 RepID=A0A7X6HB64_9MICC|nr:TasA family protein [Arthrobacter mobilis]NKX53854.1 hypothetical protein [Arthrobacter mobilis]
MNKHVQTYPRPGRGRLVAATAVGALGLAVTVGGVYASLNATAFNATAQDVGSGTLELTMANNGTGFSQQIADLAPGDRVNRYVSLTQDGSLGGRNLTLSVSDATPTKLTTDATNGLKVTVSACTGGTWNATDGTCSGTVQPLLGSTALASLASTPAAVLSGPLAAGSVTHLQMSLVLPDQTETTVNGTLPANTIQGLSAKLTWTFTEQQREASTANG